MSAGAYMVVRERKVLVLSGPFRYPTWVAPGPSVPPLSYAAAHQAASAFGGEVRSYSVDVSEAIPIAPMYGPWSGTGRTA